MKKDKIFVIGGGPLQVDFIKAIKEEGYDAVVFDYNPICEGAKLSDKFFCISIDEKEKILEIAKNELPIAIHTVATEAGNLTACYVGEKLGLNTNSFNTALNTVDKDRMKKVFEDYNIPTAQVIRIFNRSEINDIDIPYPFVVKASDSSAGRGVSLVENFREFEEAYEDAYKESNNKIVLVEEYLKGDQYSVELVSENGNHQIVGVTREFFVDEKSFVESHYLVPAINEKNIIDSYSDLFFRILSSFDIKYGATHIEFRLFDDQIKIIEIASRMGGMRDKLLMIAKKIDYNKLILNSITSKSIKMYPEDLSFALAKSLFSKRDVETYLRIHKDHCDKIIYPPKDPDKILNNIPKTLMDSKGIYYLEVKEESLVYSIINEWNQ